MKNILLTTLFTGCVLVSSVFAENSNTSRKSDCFTSKASVTAGVAGIGKTKGQALTFGKSGTKSAGDANALAASINPLALHNGKKNLTVNDSGFFGLTFGTTYNVTDAFAMSLEMFYQGMNLKMSLKNSPSEKARIRGLFGFIASFDYLIDNNFSFSLGAGLGKANKIKGLHIGLLPVGWSNKEIDDANSTSFQNSFGFVGKLGMNYSFNENLKLGMNVQMQKIKSKSKATTIGGDDYAKGAAHFSCDLYTIGATLTYNF